jgi:hypothetical protein
MIKFSSNSIGGNSINVADTSTGEEASKQIIPAFSAIQGNSTGIGASIQTISQSNFELPALSGLMPNAQLSSSHIETNISDLPRAVESMSLATNYIPPLSALLSVGDNETQNNNLSTYSTDSEQSESISNAL